MRRFSGFHGDDRFGLTTICGDAHDTVGARSKNDLVITTPAHPKGWIRLTDGHCRPSTNGDLLEGSVRNRPEGDVSAVRRENRIDNALPLQNFCTLYNDRVQLAHLLQIEAAIRHIYKLRPIR